MRLSVIIPTLNAAPGLPDCLAALGAGLEILVVDGGSTDGTLTLASDAGARVLQAPAGRGAQFAAGGAAATGAWLLFLHADTVLAPGWRVAAASFMRDGPPGHAAYFQFALDETRPDFQRAARRLERIVAWRCRVFGLPYGDQGLLIARTDYQALGGYRPLPLMEDVDLAHRIGRRRLQGLDPRAVTSATRYSQGYLRRSTRNQICLALYFLGVPPGKIKALYEAGQRITQRD